MTIFRQLMELPTDIEIKNAVWSCDPDKAPSNDGFNLRFVKKMWSSVGNNIIHFVKQFFYSSEFPLSINTI